MFLKRLWSAYINISYDNAKWFLYEVICRTYIVRNKTPPNEKFLMEEVLKTTPVPKPTTIIDKAFWDVKRSLTQPYSTFFIEDALNVSYVL